MRSNTILALTGALLVSSAAAAVELAYTWKKGDTHRFRYEDDTTFEMKMGGMPGMAMMGGAAGGGGMRIRLASEFSEKVLGVRPDGTADVELTIEKMELVQEGRRISVLEQIPAKARRVKAEIDRKGRATFYEMVTVYMVDDRMVVGVHAEAGATGGRAKARAGDEEVELVASIDPKTGAVTASAKVTKVEKKQAKKAVQVKKEDPGVDVFPKQIFQMMELPEGDLVPGSRVTVKSPLGTVAFAVPELEGAVASLRVTMEGNELEASDQGVKSKDASGMDALGGMGMMPGMDMGSMGMGMGEGPGAASPTAGMKMDCDVTGRFDTAAGRLLGLQGSVQSDMSMGGMGSMKTRSTFQLTRI